MSIYSVLPDRVLTGTMQGVDDEGRLVLQQMDGSCCAFFSGEVSLRNDP